ncbi:MFS transporter [Sulfobacillus thermosulfidooxidans]|uniref:MFS transporter n=1 Tax=Sulfobacillus thermosulfidooxidans TaxID=28034 RepID=UPI0006B46C90|nr:MFS transporter [Sulfobacillus thermosulfidooxidans]
MRVPEIFRIPHFTRFWLGQTVSAFGNNLMPIAFVFAILSLGDSAVSLAKILVVLWGVRVVVQSFGVAISDKLPRVPLMIIADGVQALALTALALLYIFHDARILWLYGEAAVEGALQGLYDPVATSLRRQLIPSASLQQVVSAQSLASKGTRIIAPLVSAFLVRDVGFWSVFLLDAGTFGFSALTLRGIRYKTPPPELAIRTSWYADFVQGWKCLIKFRWILWLALATSFNNMIMGAFAVVGPTITHRSYAGILAWAILRSATMVGGVAGVLIAYRATWPRPFVVIQLISAIFIALPMILLALHGNLIWVAVTVGLMGAALAIKSVFSDTAISQQIPARVIGRIDAWDTTLGDLLLPVAFVLAGLGIHILGVRPVLWAMAVTSIFTNISVLGFRTVRQISLTYGPTEGMVEE